MRPSTWDVDVPNCGQICAASLMAMYLIFFRYLDGDVLEIVNVLEGHRDIGTFYSRDET